MEAICLQPETKAAYPILSPKQEPMAHTQRFTRYSSHGQPWVNIPNREHHYWDRFRDPRVQEYGENLDIDPYTMDDPSFPERWRIPPGWYPSRMVQAMGFRQVVETLRSDRCIRGNYTTIFEMGIHILWDGPHSANALGIQDKCPGQEIGTWG